jgi:hypothetical protein
MSTIPSGLSAATQNYPQLSRSLINLSARTQPAAVSDDPTGSATASADAAVPADLVQAVAQQNQYSALADSAAALSANQSAAGLLASQPAAAYAAQANLSAASVLGLLQD